ncbi:MAG: ABC transporter permease subunit [Culturomica sp.]|jgi:ABC-type transport system involved in multi-copper enzyme maturation permease subunit|nr:ABC transporter permease subunit [Culturomica sp.]
MIGLIARKDFLLNLTSARFVIGLAVCLLVIPFTLLTSVDRYKQQVSVYKTASENADKEYRSVRVYSNVKPVVVHRPEALAVFSEGVSRNMGNTVRFQYGEYPLLLSGAAGLSNPLLNAFFSLDFATVIAIVLSLFALVFSYDAFTRERENNTLKMILVNRVNRSAFFIGKFLGILLTLAPMLLFCFLTGMLFLLLSPDIALDGAMWTNLLLLFLSALLYVVVFVLFGFFVSAMSKRSSTSIAVCLLCWIWFLFLVPNMAVWSAKSFVKTEQYDNMRLAMNDVQGPYWKERNEKEQEILKALDKNGISHWDYNGYDDGSLEFSGGPRKTLDYHMHLSNWEIPRLIDYADKKWAVQKEYLDGLVKQERFQQRLALLSPSEIFGQLASSLCYSDPAYYLAWMERVREYRQTFIDYVRERKLYESSAWGTRQDPENFVSDERYREISQAYEEAFQKGQEAIRKFFESLSEWNQDYGPLDVTGFPVFDYQPHTRADAYNFVLARLALLMGIALVLLMLTMLRFRNYQL